MSNRHFHAQSLHLGHSRANAIKNAICVAAESCQGKVIQRIEESWS
jgi:hypothetical protein